MSLNLANLSCEAPAEDAGYYWLYTTTDDWSTVATISYFNGASLMIRKGDFIRIVASDATRICRFIARPVNGVTALDVVETL